MQKFCACLMNNSKNKKYNYNINNNTKQLLKQNKTTAK